MPFGLFAPIFVLWRSGWTSFPFIGRVSPSRPSPGDWASRATPSGWRSGGTGRRCVSASRRPPSKLDPYKDYLLARLAEFPELSAVGPLRGDQGARLCRRPLHPQGLHPALSRRGAKNRWYASRPRPATRPSATGRDLGTHLVAGELTPLYLFVMILGFSRALYAEVVTRTDLDTFLELHVHAFRAFGGMPEEILYDNQKLVVLARRADGPVFHPASPRLRRPVRFQAPALPALSGQDQGQGGALHRLPQGPLLLRTHLHRRRRSQPPARTAGSRAWPTRASTDHRRASLRPPAAREAPALRGRPALAERPAAGRAASATLLPLRLSGGRASAVSRSMRRCVV